MDFLTIGSGNGLLPVWHKAITWTNAHLLSIGPFEINSIQILIKVQIFSFQKMQLKMSSTKQCQFCSSLNLVNTQGNATKGLY